MLKVRLIWVGKTRQGFAKEGMAFFEKRLRPFVLLETVEIKAASHSGRDAAIAVGQEGEAILGKIGPDERVVLLDETGDLIDSRGLAGWLKGAAEESVAALTFVIGGAYGVDSSVRKRAQRILALSPMTFPHQLVRLIIMEQLYRAATLNAGHGYHHD